MTHIYITIKQTNKQTCRQTDVTPQLSAQFMVTNTFKKEHENSTLPIAKHQVRHDTQPAPFTM